MIQKLLKNGDVKWCVLSSSRNISKISSWWVNKTRRQEQTAKDFNWNYFPKKVARGHIHCGSWGKIPISWPLITALQFISTCESILSTSRLNLLRCLLTKLCRDCKSINQSAVSNYHNIMLFWNVLQFLTELATCTAVSFYCY